METGGWSFLGTNDSNLETFLVEWKRVADAGYDGVFSP